MSESLEFTDTAGDKHMIDVTTIVRIEQRPPYQEEASILHLSNGGPVHAAIPYAEAVQLVHGEQGMGFKK